MEDQGLWLCCFVISHGWVGLWLCWFYITHVGVRLCWFDITILGVGLWLCWSDITHVGVSLWLCWSDITHVGVSLWLCWFDISHVGVSLWLLIWYHPCRSKFVTVLIWYHPCKSKFMTVLIWYNPCRSKCVTVHLISFITHVGVSLWLLIWYHPCRSKFVTVLICNYSCRKKSCSCVDMIWYYPGKRKVCADLILLVESLWLCWFGITCGKFVTVLIWYYPCRRKVSSQGVPVFTAWWHRMDLMRIALRKPPLLSWSQRRLLLAPWYELLKSCILKKISKFRLLHLEHKYLSTQKSLLPLFVVAEMSWLFSPRTCLHYNLSLPVTDICVYWFLQQTGLSINLFSVIATDIPSH